MTIFICANGCIAGRNEREEEAKKTQTINIIKVFVTRILMMIIYMDGNIDCDRLINANTIIEYRIEIDMQHFSQSNRICNKCSVAIKYVPIYCVNASRLNLFDPFFSIICASKNVAWLFVHFTHQSEAIQVDRPNACKWNLTSTGYIGLSPRCDGSHAVDIKV